MQIHELNPFSGTLDASAFLPVDNGNDTGKVAVTDITGPVNDRIDNIITSPAPTEQEIIDARKGWDEVIYGSLGTAVRSQIKQILAQFYKFNTYDWLAIHGTPISKTHKGVTFTWDDARQVCSVSGTATGGDAIASIFTQTGYFPDSLEKGAGYQIGFNTTDSDVKLRIAIWEDIDPNPTYTYFDDDGTFTIPIYATKIDVDLYVASGDAASAVVSDVYMVKDLTAEEVTAIIRNARLGADGVFYPSLGDAIRSQMNKKEDKVEGKGLSTNDFTDALKTKLDGIEAGAEVNIIEAVKVGGTALTPDGSRAVNIPVDDTLTQANTPADAKVVGEELEKKANIDGYYETFTSGQTEQLIATEAITDTEPYIYRKTGGPNDVGDRVYDEIVGGSVVWNQLVDSGATEVTVPNGHKYYANINGTKSIGASTGTAISINDSTEDNVIDLTAALGSTIADYVYSLETATAGAGVAWFRKYFPGVYYGFTEPTFQHVQTSGKITVGFNQWDEETANGYWDKNTGEWVASGNWVSCKNYISCLPNTGYYFKTGQNPSGSLGAICFYDYDKNFISSIVSGWGDRVNTTPNNAHYMTFYANQGYFKNDICINIHGDRDGEYEPYRKRTYPIEPKVLRGIPKLDSANRLYFDGDVYQHDGSGEYRYGEMTLDGVTSGKKFTGIWTDANNPNGNVFYFVGPSNRNTAGFMSDKFVYSSANKTTMPLYSFPGNSGTVMTWSFCLPSTVTTVAEANTWLQSNPITIVYGLDTPEPFAAEPYQSPMVVDPLGTEEFVDYGVAEGTRDVAVPVGHSSDYPADLRGKLQHLPSLASADGRYVVVQTGNQMTLSPDTSLGLIAALEARVAALEGGNG